MQDARPRMARQVQTEALQQDGEHLGRFSGGVGAAPAHKETAGAVRGQGPVQEEGAP